MLQTIAKRIDNLERNLNGRIDTLSNRMDNMNSNINILNSRMVGLENRVDNLEERIDASINEHFDKVMTGIGKITGIFKIHEEEHEILQGDHKRLIKLEEKISTLS